MQDVGDDVLVAGEELADGEGVVRRGLVANLLLAQDARDDGSDGKEQLYRVTR